MLLALFLHLHIVNNLRKHIEVHKSYVIRVISGELYVLVSILHIYKTCRSIKKE